MQNLQSWTIDDIVVTRLPPAHARSWVAIGSEIDIRHMLKTWDVVLRFHLEALPENMDVYWDLVNKLIQGHRRDTVRITNGVVELDRRRLKELRDGVDWLADYLCDEHQADYLEFVPHINLYVRRDDAPQNITERDDAHWAVNVCDNIMDITADNVVRLSDREVA